MNYVHKLRKDLRWSQAEMAERLTGLCGFVVSQKRVSEYEHGLTPPDDVLIAYKDIDRDFLAGNVKRGPERRPRPGRRTATR